MSQRVQKIIANAGVCSRRKAEDLIEQGRVSVNGKVITIGSKADLFTDVILVDEKKLPKPPKIYLAFNKPPDCLTTLDDPKGRKTILDYVKLNYRIIPVGRLDFLTQGLLLLTNDGDFANHVMHPRYEVKKSYLVFLDKRFSSKDLELIRKGVDIGDVITKPANAKFASPAQDVVEITLHEGQNRIVRRMMKMLGYSVKRLIRTRVGPVELGNLAQGKQRNLTQEEIEKILSKSTS
ncbi:rRNA pseudouridine synthase [Candidatus Woesearchaeota archaeon]|nr:rRNA pseudouridine synthase [Candidatus Woesearchaeota archaeon]